RSSCRLQFHSIGVLLCILRFCRATLRPLVFFAEVVLVLVLVLVFETLLSSRRASIRPRVASSSFVGHPTSSSVHPSSWRCTPGGGGYHDGHRLAFGVPS